MFRTSILALSLPTVFLIPDRAASQNSACCPPKVAAPTYRSPYCVVSLSASPIVRLGTPRAASCGEANPQPQACVGGERYRPDITQLRKMTRFNPAAAISELFEPRHAPSPVRPARAAEPCAPAVAAPQVARIVPSRPATPTVCNVPAPTPCVAVKKKLPTARGQVQFGHLCLPCEPTCQAPGCAPRIVCGGQESGIAAPNIFFGIERPDRNCAPAASPSEPPKGPIAPKEMPRIEPVPNPGYLPDAKSKGGPTAPSANVRGPLVQANGFDDGAATILTGTVDTFRKTWRLRYANIDCDDRCGGSVALEGAGLDRLREGQIVRVQGVMTLPTTRGQTAVFRVQAIQVLSQGR